MAKSDFWLELRPNIYGELIPPVALAFPKFTLLLELELAFILVLLAVAEVVLPLLPATAGSLIASHGIRLYK